MTDTKDILQQYAEELGYPYIEPVCDKPELSGYFVCLTEVMKRSPNGKFGEPCVITINDTGKPYRLNREQVTELCKKITSD